MYALFGPSEAAGYIPVPIADPPLQATIVFNGLMDTDMQHPALQAG